MAARRIAYFVREDERKPCGLYRILFATENCDGYGSAFTSQYDDIEEARAMAVRLNKMLDLTDSDVGAILVSAGV